MIVRKSFAQHVARGRTLQIDLQRQAAQIRHKLGIVYVSCSWEATRGELMGSLSNVVEIATGWYKPQNHLSPIHLHVAQTIGDTLQHLDLGITPFGESIGGPVIKVIQYGLTPSF